MQSYSLAYVFSSVMSSLITLLFRLIHHNLPISLCLPFVDPTDSIVMIKVITWFVAITQTATSVVIMIMHLLLVQKLKESQKNIRKFN